MTITTKVVDNLLCMKNGGTEWTIVSYLKKLIKIKREKREKDPGGRLGSPS
jgi:hypothetical protein